MTGRPGPAPKVDWVLVTVAVLIIVVLLSWAFLPSMTLGTVTGVIGMVTGAGGLWIGVLNRIHAREQSSTRVRVELILQGDEAQANKRFLVRVVNASAFVVRIDSVGLVLREDDWSLHTVQLVDIDRGHGTLPVGGRHPGGDLPVDMPARSSMRLTLDLADTIALQAVPFDHVFAITATGERFQGDPHSPLIGKTLMQIRAAAATA
jgi:hypothetical protein